MTTPAIPATNTALSTIPPGNPAPTLTPTTTGPSILITASGVISTSPSVQSTNTAVALSAGSTASIPSSSSLLQSFTSSLSSPSAASNAVSVSSSTNETTSKFETSNISSRPFSTNLLSSLSNPSPTSQQSTTSSTSSPTPTPPPNGLRTSLIATAAVLGGLLALVIVALIFLLIRNRRNSRSHKDYDSNDSTIELKDSPERTIRSLQATIAGLEKNLTNRDSTIRHAQAAALKNGHQFGDSSLGDAQVRDRFTALSHSINDWVLTYFKRTRSDNVQFPDVAEALQRAVPEYKRLIEEPRTRYLVVRAVIANILLEAFANGQLLGGPMYRELKRGLDIDPNGFDFREWDASTVALLENSPRAQKERATAIQNIVDKIDRLTSRLAGLGYDEQRLNHLQASIESAAKLAIALAKQPAIYTLASERPGAPFDPDTMDDTLQETAGQSLKGRKIQGTVFPAVKKRSFSEGSAAAGQSLCIRKAQVIV